jgi:CTP synthase (UTP-ammonia lyase)
MVAGGRRDRSGTPPEARIVVLGDRNVEYLTHRELDGALGLFPDWASADWVATDSSEARALGDIDGLWLVPGSPYRDTRAVCAAIKYAREGGIPLLGTCSGFQYTVMEYARNVAALDVAHGEAKPDADALVIEPLQCQLVGKTRTVNTVAGTRLAEICGTEPFTGFHWCSYGLAQRFVEPLEAAGMTVSAHAQDAGVEAVELASHPFFLASLFQPQVGARDAGRLPALIHAFLVAAREHATAGEWHSS